MLLFNILYRIEHDIADMPNTVSDAEKLAICQKWANRVFKRLRRKISTTHATSKSPLGKAITYTKNHLDVLPNYLTELRFKLDNNAVEQKIRPITMGRRNYLFVGSERGGETTAIFMSLISTCKAAKVNPFKYLKDVLSRINSHPHKQLAELLPHN